MSKSLLRPARITRHCERYLQICAHQHQHHPRDDTSSLLPPQHRRLQHHRNAARPFSTSAPSRASRARPSGSAKMQSQPSLAVAQARERKKQMDSGLLPDDLGLMPETFIMPRGKNLPGWLQAPRRRWKLEKKWAWAKLKDLASILMYRYRMVTPRPRLNLRSIAPLAKDLHSTLYTQLAAGELAQIENSVCSGLLRSLRIRIAQRAPGIYLKWTIHEYLSAPALKSYKVTFLPTVEGKVNRNKDEQNIIVQAVVRLHSMQSLQHVKRKTTRDRRGKLETRDVLLDVHGVEIKGTPVPEKRESLEYFVLQKMWKKSEEGEWMVWGTAQETRLEELELAERGETEVKAMAKAKAG